MFRRFHELCREITFHPRGHREPCVESLLAQAAAGDD
jgi:hypothetical protein